MNRIMSGGFFLCGGFLFLSAGCGKSSGPVVAQVHDVKITLADLETRLAETPQEYQQYVVSPEGRREFLNVLIREKVVLTEARRAGMEKQPAYERAVAHFEEDINRREKEYRESLLVESYIRRLRSQDLAVTDAEVQRYYEAHRNEFDHPVEIEASHILVGSEIEANTVLDRLKQGESFEKLARELSKDPATAARGGKFIPFRQGSFVPEIEEATSRLKVGEISGLVKTPFGFHIIKKTGQIALPVRPFEEVKEEIRSRLEREKFDHWVQQKEASLGVTFNEKALSAFAPIAASTATLSEEPPSP
jgi:peptidyl-prolyl cis-trans isomerase C